MVVWDHLMVDFTLFGNSWMSVDWLNRLSIFGWDYVGSDLRIFWRPVFLFIFFTVSGLCTAFSKNNLWRGIKLALVSIGLSIFTYLFSLFSGEDYFILFGVLHCMAAIIIIYALLRLAWEGMFKLVEFFRKKEISPIVKKLAFCFVCLALSAVFFGFTQNTTPAFMPLEKQNSLITTRLLWVFSSTDSFRRRTISRCFRI